jgi:hypothetical protein
VIGMKVSWLDMGSSPADGSIPDHVVLMASKSAKEQWSITRDRQNEGRNGRN